jgi:hypothetical protein
VIWSPCDLTIRHSHRGWRISLSTRCAPLSFVCGGALEALPIPAPSKGDANLLRGFLNVETEDDFRLLIAWLFGCLHQTGPYQILILTGEQGSAKSTAARILRNLRDGNARHRRLKADRALLLVRPKPLRPTRHQPRHSVRYPERTLSDPRYARQGGQVGLPRNRGKPA